MLVTIKQIGNEEPLLQVIWASAPRVGDRLSLVTTDVETAARSTMSGTVEEVHWTQEVFTEDNQPAVETDPLVTVWIR